jgi:hypothetical protein
VRSNDPTFSQARHAGNTAAFEARQPGQSSLNISILSIPVWDENREKSAILTFRLSYFRFDDVQWSATSKYECRSRLSRLKKKIIQSHTLD